jgi:hypothetical protein
MKLASAIFSDLFHFRFSASAALRASKYSMPGFKMRTTRPDGSLVMSAYLCLHKKTNASEMSASQSLCLSRTGVKSSPSCLHFIKSGSRRRSSRSASRIHIAVCSMVVAMMSNDQLTDGGPPLPSGLPGRLAGPPFGEAAGWAFTSCEGPSRSGFRARRTEPIQAPIPPPTRAMTPPSVRVPTMLLRSKVGHPSPWAISKAQTR